MNELQIGNKIAKVPIIQGGMGVGVSRSKLAGAVAGEGGIGIISTAQIGYDEAEFETDPAAANRKAIVKHIRLAKEKAKNGLVGVNIMVALKDYADHVKAAVAAGADVIISGAGIPAKLPEYVEGSDTKIAPIVSSAKAAKVLLQRWEKKYHRTADFIVVDEVLAAILTNEIEVFQIGHDLQRKLKSRVDKNQRDYTDCAWFCSAISTEDTGDRGRRHLHSAGCQTCGFSGSRWRSGSFQVCRHRGM